MRQCALAHSGNRILCHESSFRSIIRMKHRSRSLAAFHRASTGAYRRRPTRARRLPAAGRFSSTPTACSFTTLSSAKAPPLVVLHGGPGADHTYFLPWLLPLARTHRLIFIDERGSGQLRAPAGREPIHRRERWPTMLKPFASRLAWAKSDAARAQLRRRAGRGLRAQVSAALESPDPEQHLRLNARDE